MLTRILSSSMRASVINTARLRSNGTSSLNMRFSLVELLRASACLSDNDRAGIGIGPFLDIPLSQFERTQIGCWIALPLPQEAIHCIATRHPHSLHLRVGNL